MEQKFSIKEIYKYTMNYIIIRHQPVFISNPFVPNAPFLYPLKTLENLTFFLCFRGVEKECIGNKWVNVMG